MANFVPVLFWRSPNGREPVREWLKGLSPEDRKVIGYDLRKVQVGWPVGMPLSRSLGNGLWELRSTLPSHTIARVIFVLHDGAIVLLNGFIKKSQKTPASEIALARTRAKDMDA
ncbi:MAG: type II toxin-antitoxin system RelE/ParE family toxin [Hyphomicrobiaceae bacterium]